VGTADEVESAVTGKSGKPEKERTKTPDGVVTDEGLLTAEQGARPSGGENASVEHESEPASGEDKAVKRAKRAGRGKSKPAKRAGKGRRRGQRRPATAKPRVTKSSDTEAQDDAPISRRELLERALGIIEEELDLDGNERPANTISSLVQLLKLDRSLKVDDEKPHEIRIVWQETNEEMESGSAEESPGT
jgi:hypothetical protein